ncbi:type IV secretion system protein [Candidatus Symbiopectobacterium sp. NZEC135]|uniref:type IV secretion system protein n=1 Tax=Candidatus Symbiopectobacterium sp. NZEC135 TaxID=2820471 RepID=UPI002227483D|nr:type IV secretion system protein [Candidatus Symbiopectobacterium sp. NZEC135]MCW2482038.1 type IV secretion system protein [Candidatus Symbiopectobacterium sp. NZEC135]
MSAGLFVGMDKAITDGLHAVLQGQTAVYGNMIRVIAVSSFTLFITYRGYQTLAGKRQTPVEDIAWDMGRMALVMTFVLNLGGWLDIALLAIDGLREGVSGNDNVWALLDTVWEKTQVIAQQLYQRDESTYLKLNGSLAEGLVWGGALITLLLGTAVNLLAEITILLMTTTAPLFIFCLLYGFLIPMFNNWLKIIFTAILTVMFSALSIRIVINYLNGVFDEATHFADNANIITLGAQCAIAGAIAGIIIFFSAKIASALASIAVHAALQGAAMAGIGGGIRKSADATRPTLKAGASAARLVAKGSITAGKAIASTTGNAISAWQKRAASIESMKHLNLQRHR